MQHLLKLTTLAFTFLIVITSCLEHRPFDSTQWKQGGGENITTDKRLEMTKDLIDSEILFHKHKTLVDSLLGLSSDLFFQTIKPNVIELYTIKEEYTSDIDPDKIFYLKVGYDWEKKCVLVEQIDK